MLGARWQVGSVQIGKVVEFEAPLPGGGAGSMIPDAYPDAVREMPWLIPDFATEDGHLRIAIQSVLVETPTHRIVIDTCVGNGKRRSIPLFNMWSTEFLANFEAASGWRRADVDMVICTHLHTDHVGWNTMADGDSWVPTFPNARYCIGRTEYEHWSGGLDEHDSAELLRDSIQPLFDAGLVDLVAADQQLLPELRMLPTHGHTPGHASVVIESNGERAVVTGDMMHHACQIGRPHWGSDFDSDTPAAVETRRSFLASVAGTSTLVLGTHFGGPTIGRVEADGDAYRFAAVRSGITS